MPEIATGLTPRDTDDPLCFRQESGPASSSTNIHGAPLYTRCHSQASSDSMPRSNLAGNARIDDCNMDCISLTELAHLHRRQRYYEKERARTEQCLQVFRTSWTIRNRLIQGRNRLTSELAKALRSENQKAFLPLYKAFHTAKVACEEYDRTDHRLSLDEGPQSSTRDHRLGPFIDRLPESSCDVLIQFLCRIAGEPHFLLQHLLCLSNKEFDALLKHHSPSSLSVFRSSGISQSTAYKDKLNPDVLDTFLDFGRHDFLSLLINIVGAGTTGASDPRIHQYWAKVCAGLLSNKKPGAENFIMAIMDAWPVPERYGSPRVLEDWLLEVLRDGDFLLEKPNVYSFRSRAQYMDGSTTGDTESTEAFFPRSLNSLLQILKDSSLSAAIPHSILSLGRAIVKQTRESGNRFQGVPHFLCSQWLFSSYTMRLIKNPEVQYQNRIS